MHLFDIIYFVPLVCYIEIMKIGLIISHFGIGGASTQFLHLEQELRKKGHQTYIYCLSNDTRDIDPSLLKGVIIRSLHKKQSEKKTHSQVIGFFLYLSDLLKDCFLLSKLIEKDSLDVLNPHEWPIHWAAVFVKFKKHIPIVWMCNNVWHIPGEEEKTEKRIIFSLGTRVLIQPLDIFLTSFID